MAKLTAWLVTLVGLLLVLAQLNVLGSVTQYNDWLIALAVLVIGISKLVRNYQVPAKKRK